MSIFKLKGFLTPRNLQFLSVMFRIILDRSETAHDALWRRFDQILPEGSASLAREKLGQLRDILEEYRGKK